MKGLGFYAAGDLRIDACPICGRDLHGHEIAETSRIPASLNPPPASACFELLTSPSNIRSKVMVVQS